jgi:hypothetical protein
MAYIGKTPVIGNFVKLDSITVVNGQAAYTMQNGGVNFTSYDNVNQFLVSLNGVLQAPTDSFTVSGSTLTFASNLSTGDVIDFVLVLGNSLDIGTPSDNTVTAAKLNNDIISGSTELASEPADTDEFLVSDAGTLKRIDYSLIKGGGITMADQFRLTAAYTFSSPGDLTANLERVDGTNQGTLGTGMSESSGIFTFPSTGYYLVRFSAQQYKNGDRRDVEINIKTTANNSSYANIANCKTHITQSASSTTYIQGMTETLLDITDTSNQKVKFNVFTDATTAGDTALNQTFMTFLRIGDT